MTYTCLVKNADGSLVWEIPYNSFSFTEELNRGETASFSFDVANIKPISDYYSITPEFIFSGSYREIELYDSANVKIFAGYVAEAQFDVGENSSGTISVIAKGFFSLLEKRFTDGEEIYTSEDSGDIAWDLILDSQALTYGDFGITRGVHPTTKDRDRTFRYKNIAEAIKKMSADEVKDGYDFDINTLKQFNIYYPKGTERYIYLEEGFNIDSYTIRKTFIDGMINQVIVTGSGDDATNQLVVTRDSDVGYKSAFFLLQDVLSEPDIIETTTLNDKGDAVLDEFQSPRYTINVNCRYENPLWTDFSTGDWLNVYIPSFSVNNTYRVSKRSCNQDGRVSLTLREY